MNQNKCDIGPAFAKRHPCGKPIAVGIAAIIFLDTIKDIWRQLKTFMIPSNLTIPLLCAMSRHSQHHVMYCMIWANLKQWTWNLAHHA